MDKERAQGLVAKALESGKLVRQPCEVCGLTGTARDGRSLVHAHHDDYGKPLEVRWLCNRHHRLAHRHAEIGDNAAHVLRAYLSDSEVIDLKIIAIDAGVSVTIWTTRVVRAAMTAALDGRERK